MTSAYAIGFDVRPSPALHLLTTILVALATAAPLFTGLPWTLRVAFSMGILGFGVRRLLALRRPAVVAVSWSAADVWRVTLAHGASSTAELRGARLLAGAVFLHLHWPDGAGHLALLPDNVPADDLRRLRARLHSGRGAATSHAERRGA